MNKTELNKLMFEDKVVDNIELVISEDYYYLSVWTHDKNVALNICDSLGTEIVKSKITMLNAALYGIAKSNLVEKLYYHYNGEVIGFNFEENNIKEKKKYIVENEHRDMKKLDEYDLPSAVYSVITNKDVIKQSSYYEIFGDLLFESNPIGELKYIKATNNREYLMLTKNKILEMGAQIREFINLCNIE